MGKITSNELSESLNDLIDEKLNTEEYSLMTENKTIVGAINEIYGKEIIANAIGEPLDRSDTFAEMSNDINSLLSSFKTNMMNNGIVVESGDKFKQLIDKIATMVEEGSGKGIQFAEGVSSQTIANNSSCTINMNLDFEPNMIFCLINDLKTLVNGQIMYLTNVCITSVKPTIKAWPNHQTINKTISMTNITQESFTLNIPDTGYSNNLLWTEGGLTWYAIGVGEENSAIENSIISILKAKGYDESKDNIIDFIENKLYTKIIGPGTNVTIATGEGLESRRSENNQLFTKSLIVPSLSNLESDIIKGISLKVVSWAYHDDDYGPGSFSMSDGYFRIQIKRDGVVINNVFESSAYYYSYNNGLGTTQTYNLLDVQEGDVIEYTVGYYASGYLGTNVHEYHFGVKEIYLTYNIGYVASL